MWKPVLCVDGLPLYILKEESPILEKECWSLNWTAIQKYTSLRCSFRSSIPKFTGLHYQGITDNDTPSPRHPSPPPVLWLAGIFPLLLIGRNSDWGSSHFVFLFAEPGLCMFTRVFLKAHTQTKQLADREEIFAENDKKYIGLESMNAPLCAQWFPDSWDSAGQTFRSIWQQSSVYH